MANKISMKVLKESAKLFDVELSQGDVNAAAEELLEFFRETIDEDNMVECQSCRMEGPEYDEDGELIPSCPYCGILFSGDEAEETEEEEKPEKKKSTKGTKKSGKDKKAPAKKRGRPPKEKEPVEIVPLTPEEEKEFKESIDRIRELRVSLAKNAWQIGTELNKLNANENGWRSFGFETFENFCQKQLDISRSGAYKYMKTAREFEEEQFLKLGIKKAELIASAPVEYREDLIANVEDNNASHPELRAQLNELQGKVSNASEKTLTLNSRIREGDIEVPWLSGNTHKPIKRRETKNKYVLIQLSQEVELALAPSDNDLGLIAQFRKIQTTDKK